MEHQVHSGTVDSTVVDVGLTAKARKRRRPPLSCIPCHRRKLKCDRESPACGRCRATPGQECVYRQRGVPALPDPLAKRSQGPSSSTGPANSEEERTGERATEPQPPPSTRDATSDSERREGNERTRDVHEVIIYKGNDYLTKFYGYSYHRNLYQQFDKLRPYIQRLKAQHPSINRLRDEIHTLKIDTQNWKSCVGTVNMGVISNADLRRLFPERKVADELLNIYITRFEATHRVLYLPTFLKEYQQQWNGLGTTTTISLVQVLLAMATALSLQENLTCCRLGRETVGTWITACESWLTTDPFRPPPQSWTMLTTQCLLIVAKRANHIQGNEVWIATGALLRSAMAAGYHREPNQTANISGFHREMRRRLWATVIELDLQASMDRGIPPSLREDDFNTRPPLNINDDAIQEPAGESSTPLGLESLTDTSFQAVAYRSLSLRLRICALINNSHVTTIESRFPEALAMEEEAMEALASIPSTWVSSAAEEWRTQRPLYLRTMLELLLRQYLMVLYMPFASRGGGADHAKYAHVRRARLETATCILSQFKTLVDHGVVPPSACSNAQFQAAVMVCHDLYLENSCFASTAVLRANPGFAESFIVMAERVLPMLESRVSVLAKGLNEYYVLTMVLGLVKSHLWVERSAYFNSEAVERITRIMMTLMSIWKLAGTALMDRDTAGRPVRNMFPDKSSEIPRDPLTAVPDASVDGNLQVWGSRIPHDLDFLQDNCEPNGSFDMWGIEDDFFTESSVDYSMTTTHQRPAGI